MTPEKETLSVSVVIPVRNGERSLTASLESLAAQRRRPDEVVVVDNNSTDRTALLVKQWMLTHPDLHLHLVAEEIPGPSAARNRGVKIAKGDVTAFLDADCVAPPHWIEEILEEITQGSDAVGGPYEGSALPDVEKYAAMSWFLENRPGLLPLSHPFVTRFLLGGNMAVRRRVLEAAGGFDERLRTGEDLALSFRLREKGAVLRIVPRLAVTHHLRSTPWKRVRRAFSHGMLQAAIARRAFPHRIIVTFFGRSWQSRFPLTAALEGTSLTKTACALWGLGLFQPVWAWGLFAGLVLGWEFRMCLRFSRLRLPVTWREGVSIPAGWALGRLAMEAGRLAGSLRHGVFCW